MTLGMIILTVMPFCLKESGFGGEVPLFPLAAWQGVGLQYGDQLMLRNESEATGALLLKHNRLDTIYRYDPRRRTLSAESDAVWRGAQTPIAECGKQGYPTPSLLRIDTQSHRLFAGERVIQAAGRTALKLAAAPSGKFTAVLSASGEAGTSVLPSSGGSGASGQYYHQIMSLPDAKALGQPVRLPVQRSYDSLIPCWSADEKYIVYHQVTFNYLLVVQADPSSFSQP